jgi:hypothetical protein
MEIVDMPMRTIFATAAAALLAGVLVATPAAAQNNGNGGGAHAASGGGAPSNGGGGGGGRGSFNGGGGGGRGSFNGGGGGGAPTARNFAGNGHHNHGHYGRHFANGPVYGGIGVFGFGVPYLYDNWGYADDEPECYLRRVRIHHHWVWRQFCD